MTRKSRQCGLCSDPLFLQCTSHAQSCTVGNPSNNQYAALDALISYGTVPVSEAGGMLSKVPTTQVACVRPELESASTLLAVMHAYSGFENSVHVGKPDDVTVESLLVASVSLSSHGRMGVHVCVLQDPKGYRVVSTASAVPVFVDDKGVVEALTALLDDGKGFVWYWDTQMHWVAPMVHGAGNNVWVQDYHKDAPVGSSFFGCYGSRLLQRFYTRAAGESLVTANTGPCLHVPRGHAARAASYVFCNDVDKDGKCYFCAYLCKVHEKVHTQDRAKPPLYEMEVEPDFASET